MIYGSTASTTTFPAGRSPIRSEMFSTGYGFVVDYLAEILQAKRSEDFSDKCKDFTSLDNSISTRPGRHPQDLLRADEALHPTGEATRDDVRKLLGSFAIEGPQARKGLDPADRRHHARQPCLLPVRGQRGRVARRLNP